MITFIQNHGLKTLLSAFLSITYNMCSLLKGSGICILSSTSIK
jgi:hypothetical protein